MRWTTRRTGLGRAELATTAAALAISSAAYLVRGAPYLALGVVGDGLGLAVLAVPLVTRGRRLRHEALVCLAGIALVYPTGWTWPLRVPSAVWWTVIAIDLGGYLLVRAALLGSRSAREVAA